MGSSGRSSGATAKAVPGPEDQGLITWAYGMEGLSTQGGVTGGVLQLNKLPIRAAASVTNILVNIQAVGVTLTTGQNFAALYSSAGALLGVSADQTVPWVSIGLKTMAIVGGPVAVPAGFVYAALWSVGSTIPSFFRCNNSGGGPMNAGLAAPNLRFATADTGLTTTAPANFGAQSSSGTVPWFALS